MIHLYFLIPAANMQIFNPTPELVMPSGTPANEAKAETETPPMTAETNKKINKKMFQVILSPTHISCFSLIKSLCFIFSKS